MQSVLLEIHKSTWQPYRVLAGQGGITQPFNTMLIAWHLKLKPDVMRIWQRLTKDSYTDQMMQRKECRSHSTAYKSNVCLSGAENEGMGNGIQ